MITIIAYHQQDARKVAEHFGLPMHHLLTKRSFTLRHGLNRGVYYLMGHFQGNDEAITPAEAAEKWPLAYVQYIESAPAKVFIETLEPIMRRKKAQMLRIARWWMDRFPVLHYTLTEESYDCRLLVKVNSGVGGVPLYDFFLAKKLLMEYSYKQEWSNYFDERYPNLHVRVFGDEEKGYFAQAWVRRDGHCGESVNWSASVVLSSVDFNNLVELNEEAGKALQDGWFFCTNCQTAKPQDEFGYSWFASNRCKSCLTPEWLREAKAQRYN